MLSTSRLRGAPHLASGQQGSVRAVLERLRLTPAGAVLLVAAALTWGGARLTGSRTVYLLAYSAVAVMVIAAVAGQRRMRLQVERSQLPARMRAGQANEVHLTVTTSRRVSTVVLEESLHDRLGSTQHLPVATLGAGEELVHRYVLRPQVRGVYTVGPCVAVWSDPFGLTVHRQQLAEAVDVLVHPQVETVHDRVLTRMWEDPPIRPPVSKPWPTGFEFYGMRDYVRGDDLRRVVWAVVAKTGKMMVRESEQGIIDRVVLVVDTTPERHSPGVLSDTLETAIRTAASLGARHLQDGFSLSLLTNAGPVHRELRGGRSRHVFLDALARLEPDPASLHGIGPALLAAVRGGAHVVVVTPHVDADTASQLRLAIDRGASVAVALVTWEESDPASLTRAGAVGCRVVEVPLNQPLEALFSLQVGAGARR